ncbi:DUF2157 domain-containing protein [Glaciimonas sp. PCH181]|uniref:DUF2157 domain-containing protein n=1 Tax=Glaciimonas sp. PCH181 TaxID=2133943 RepID=UPI001CEC1B0B|nr:DUF2157 domain-containing protein [Glaciimonas sp. PCH181]
MMPLAGQSEQTPLASQSPVASSLRPVITHWLQEKQLSPSAAERALQLSGDLPTSADWKRFLTTVFLFSGALFLVAGVIFFFAFNWQALPRIAKFSLLQGVLIIAALLARHFTLDTLKGQVALLAAMLLCGALLAYFGQTYQTGADPYQLFVTWSILIFPWVLVSRLNTAWCLWLGLLNLGLLLYLERVTLGFFDLLELGNRLPLSLFGLNLVVWGGAEIILHRSHPRSEVAANLNRYRHFIRFAGLLLLAVLTVGILSFIILPKYFADRSIMPRVSSIAMLVVLAGFFLLYRRRRDLLLLTGSCLALITIGAAQLIVMFFSGGFNWLVGFMIVGLFLVSASTAAALWLRNLQRGWQKEGLA